MKLTARLALSQLKVNKRRTIWTIIGIILSAAIITTVFSLGFGSGLEFIDRLIGDSDSREVYEQTVSGLAFVMSLITMGISIVVVSNAFRISASERSAQFGILKSVGATKKQIVSTVLYEGLFLTIIGIPIGIALGFLFQFIGIHVINHFLERMLDAESVVRGVYDGVWVYYIFSFNALILSIGISFFTVIISAWLPARKIAKISAINAIRGIGEVQVKNKKTFTTPLISKIFGYEGALSAKFLKRSKRNFRATVVSISFSIIIFIMAGSFLTQMSTMVTLLWPDTDATGQLIFWSYSNREIDDNGNEIDNSRLISTVEMHDLATQLQEVMDEQETIFAFNVNSEIYRLQLPSTDEMLAREWQEIYELIYTGFGVPNEFHLNVNLISLDPVNYKLLSELADVPVGSNILLNRRQFSLWDTNRLLDFEPIEFSGQTLTLTGRGAYGESYSMEMPLDAQLTGDQIPNEILQFASGDLIIVVPETVGSSVSWMTNTENQEEVIRYAVDNIFADLIAEESGRFVTFDIEREIQRNRDMTNLVMFLVYGFIGVLITIGITSVISTISENVRSRAKEFAVLQSIGMTSEGIKKMLQLESIFCSIKALAIGIAIGLIGAYWLNVMMGLTASFHFVIPWLVAIQAVVGVFIITWLTMLVVANRLKQGNIIETIRSGSEM